MLSIRRCVLSFIIPALAMTSQCVWGQDAAVTEQASTPPGFERVLERGKIASIDKPEFLMAGEAEVAEDSWVLGVVMGGEARAYSLSLLNHHEVVNDVIAGKAVAAVW